MSHNKRGGYSSSSRKNLIYGIVIVVLAALLGVLLWMNKVDEDKKSAELQALNKKLYQEEQEKQAALKQKEAEDSFYQKLADGFNVNILIIGDSIGEGSGASSSNSFWVPLLQADLKKSYDKNKISFTNISMGGNASYAGYVRTMALKDDVNYDLAIICYGQNDSTDGFSTNYESIIRAIRSKYPDCSIISILESSQREYTEKMTTIQSICEHYGIPVADTIDAFNNSGKAYDDLSNDGVHPNDAGQKIYFETVKAVIDDYTEKVTLDDLAERFFVNKFYLSKIFKETYGTTVNNYLISKRITRAKQLLRFTDMTVDEIGVAVGMGDANYFSRMFRKVEGSSPSEYRKQLSPPAKTANAVSHFIRQK